MSKESNPATFEKALPDQMPSGLSDDELASLREFYGLDRYVYSPSDHVYGGRPRTPERPSMSNNPPPKKVPRKGANP